MTRIPSLNLVSTLALLWALAWTTFISNGGSAAGDELVGDDGPSRVERQWILVTTPELLESAKPLVKRREAQGWTTAIVELEADAKNWRKVATDLRDSLAKKCRSFSGTSVVLLLGDWEPAAIPPLRGQHGRMAELATDHGFGLPEPDGTVTVAVGRLPARTPKESSGMIAKIIAFESVQPKQNRIGVVVGHPGGATKTQQMIAGSIIKGAVESRLKKLPSSWSVDCIMDVEGSAFSVDSDKFSDATVELLKRPQQILVYSGHSAASGLASRAGRFYSREAFRKSTSKSPVGAFFSCGCFGCQISGFDGVGYGVAAIRSPNGPASVIGAYNESYAAPGQLALDGALASVADENAPELLGEYWRATQRGITQGKISPTEFYLYDQADGSNGRVSLKDQRLEHAEMWTLLGDPGMKMPLAPAGLEKKEQGSRGGAEAQRIGSPETIATDLLIVGGTESGWAAAIQAARLGVESITIVHDGEWLGGQFTEQALACVDENKGVGKVGFGVDWHPMKRSFQRSGLFRELMDRIEAFNAEKYGSEMPGKPYHGPSTFRPVEAEAIFREMLQPYIDSGQVKIYRKHYPVGAKVTRTQDGRSARLNSVSFAPIKDKQPDLVVVAKITIDASDWGEAIQVSGAEFECGPDPQSRYGEASAPVDLSNNPPNEMNPITWAMIVVEGKDQVRGETPIEKPARFDNRNYPRATHFSREAFGKLRWDNPNPGIGAISHWPDRGKESARQLSVYTVRRIVDGYASKTGQTMILLNYMNGQDYPLERLPQPVCDALEATEPGASLKNIVKMTRAQREIVFADAKQHAKGVLYHLQNFVHEQAPDKTNSFLHFQLSSEFGTADNLPPKPYIRESLRLKAMYMMREQDGRNRDGQTKVAATERFAHVMYPDGLFAWQFHYDFHRTGRTYLADEGASGPWIDFHKPNRHTSFLSDRATFPMRSLIPLEMDGLLGAQKNLGYSSIVSAAIRLHDQCIAVGQAAGAIAAVTIRTGEQPRTLVYQREQLEAVRHALCGEVDGAVPLLIWPFRDIEPEHPAYVATNRLAAIGGLPLGPHDVDFQPDETASKAWKTNVTKLSSQAKKITSDTDAKTQELLAAEMTRGEFCIRWWTLIGAMPYRPFARRSPADADLDDIADADDPFPFTPNKPIRFEIERKPLTPSTDGIPDDKANPQGRSFNFCGVQVPATPGFTNDHGHKFDTKRGYGWAREVTTNHRRRGALEGVLRDTFLFTRTKDSWECLVENGKYRVTICVGDSGHEQLQQRVAIEGVSAINDLTTAAGQFAERSVDVEVTDGRLTVELGSGKPMSNTCVNWLRLTPLPPGVIRGF